MITKRLSVSLVLIIAALLTLAACETSFEVDLPDHEPVLVVNGLFRVDSLWVVNLSHSVPVGENLFLGESGVEDATVVVMSGGQVVDTLRKAGSRTYRSRTHHPQPGRTYTLRASAPGYETVTATSRVPAPVPFTVSTRVVEDELRESTVDMTVRFTDPAGEANHYLLLLRERVIMQSDSTRELVTIRQMSFESSDPIFIVGNYDCALTEQGLPRYGRFGPAAIFDDTDIDGETYEIELTAHLSTAFGDEERTFEHVVLLVSLSKPYFRFKESIRCTFGGDNPFTGPVRRYSNVEGGLGIFAGSSAMRRRIEIGGEG